MKKTFSITIGGQIFHIEEDGYDQLRRYLDSIQKYFAAFPDSFEIVSDVESRIAELLQTRMQSSFRQAITLEDVQYVQTTMGTVEDFMAAETLDADATAGAGTGSRANAGSSSAYTAGEPQARIPLIKDRNDKVLTGVCAGLAGWLRIDPLWVRLLTVVLTTGLMGFGGLGSVVVVVYLVLAVALPEGEVPAWSKPQRRFFRDPETKRLGGVAGGLANYFGADLGLMRVLLVLTALFGFGLILYLVLWVSTRYAVTTTERLQMKGNPVTLSEIESSLKENLNSFRSPRRPGEPSLLERILLLPFQIIATLFKAIGPILRAIGIIVGVILLVVLMFVFFAVLVLGVNVMRGGWDPVSDSMIQINIDGYDWKQFLPIMPPYLGVLGLTIVVIPMLFLLFLAIALVAGRWRVNRYASWSLVGIWVLALIVFMAQALPFAQRFDNDETFTAQTTQTLPADTLEISTREVGGDNFRRISLRLKAGQPGDTLIVVQSVEGHGPTDEAALHAAKAARFGYSLERSTFRFDNAYTLEKPQDFAKQDAEMLLIIPQGKPFRLDHRATDALDEPTHFEHDIYKWDAQNRTLQFNERGKLECLDCPRSADDVDIRVDEDDVSVHIDVDDDDRDRFEDDRQMQRERVYRDSSGSVRMTISTDEDSAGIHMDVKDNQGQRSKKVRIHADKKGVRIHTDKK